MLHPMDGCWAKIERANENIHNLADEHRTFVRLHLSSYGLRTEVDAEAQQLIVKAVGDEIDIPLRFSVLVGEIVHHLRSSLDHLMYALVARYNRAALGDEKRTRNLNFPVAKTTPRPKFETRYRSEIEGLPCSAVATLKALQPYKDGIAAEAHPLAILHSFNNADKHRLLLVVGAVLATPDEVEALSPGKFASTFFFPVRYIRPSKDGTELLNLRTAGAGNPGMQMRFSKGAAQIAFDRFGMAECSRLSQASSSSAISRSVLSTGSE